MAQGFKKYFNSTTISGRANVAKATYASIALLYIIYRVRSRKKSTDDEALDAVGNEPVPETRVGKEKPCGCDEDPRYNNPPMSQPPPPPPPPTQPPPPPSPKSPSEPEKKKDCAVCRDRIAKSAIATEERRRQDDTSSRERENNGIIPSNTKKRRDCPCEDPHKHDEGIRPETEKRARMNELLDDGCASYKHSHSAVASTTSTTATTTAQPLVEQVNNIQKAVVRALRGMISAFMGDASTNDAQTNTGNANSSSSSNSQSTSYDSSNTGTTTNRSRQHDNDDYENVSDYDKSAEDANPGSYQTFTDDDFLDDIGPDIFYEN